MALYTDTVMVERLDKTVASGGKSVDLPCFGVFEMRDGKVRHDTLYHVKPSDHRRCEQIAVWRDYFDMGTFTKAMM